MIRATIFLAGLSVSTLAITACSSKAARESAPSDAQSQECALYAKELRACFHAVGVPDSDGRASAILGATAISPSEAPTRSTLPTQENAQRDESCARERARLKTTCR